MYSVIALVVLLLVVCFFFQFPQPIVRKIKIYVIMEVYSKHCQNCKNRPLKVINNYTNIDELQFIHCKP